MTKVLKVTPTADRRRADIQFQKGIVKNIPLADLESHQVQLLDDDPVLKVQRVEIDESELSSGGITGGGELSAASRDVSMMIADYEERVADLMDQLAEAEKAEDAWSDRVKALTTDLTAAREKTQDLEARVTEAVNSKDEIARSHDGLAGKLDVEKKMNASLNRELKTADAAIKNGAAALAKLKKATT